ncbi:MAG: hypothetical protein ACLQU3_11320 [Limisphaerales bacterium]
MNDLNPSRKLAARPRAGCFLALFLLAGLPAMRVTQAAGLAATNAPSAIPWNQIGAKAGADYQGDGLAVTPTESGARLHCVFQRLDGEATPEGLWLTSTVTNTVSDRFRVTAMAVGRAPEKQKAESRKQKFEMGERRAESGKGGSEFQLADTGKVSVDGQTVRLSRPGLTEEYSVSMDGVRQDFIVEQAPLSPPAGELVVKLAVSGAQVEPAADGARLVLEKSGRKIAYSRLRVTDATGKELAARMEVASGILPDVEGAHPAARNSGALRDTPESAGLEAQALRQAGMPDATSLAVVVNDAEAVYPVRIDPTFSDANWVSMGGIPGASGEVLAAVTDGSGNLYIGGEFTVVGNTLANYIAEWNGSSWSALGSGMGGNSPVVLALAVSGSTLYAGGNFMTAGGNVALRIAQWNGSTWSALGLGINGEVFALAVSGSTLYAGGNFTTAGGNAVNHIAQWNGSSWSALGSGMGGGNGYVRALAVSGSTLYAGGEFTTAGGNLAYYIARWNGSSWSALGSGMGNFVSALAVSGSTLYAGGYFGTAGGVAANYIAQWNGSSWSALGSGISGAGSDGGIFVNALAVSGSTLYAGGDFTTAGGNAANYIAQWNGTSWSALGSGMNGLSSSVEALAVSGSTLYAGGDFTTAGGSAANYIARWNGSSWSALGSGMSGPVSALAVSGSTLFVGGLFTTAGGSAANHIARWNGSSWSALGSGISGAGSDGGLFVNALAVSGSTLYAGGEFTTAGGSAANSIAQWNGASWSPLGSGIGVIAYPDVRALAVSGSTLYAGGYFTNAGGNAATNIAQWNGSSWSALGSGMNNEVSALAVSGSTLYAGGFFTNAGGNAANYIAQWNGSSWSALGSGMNSDVYALAVSGGTLYAGGDFTTAGANFSAYAALAYLPGSLAIITTNAAFGFTSVVFGFDVSGPSGASVVIQASTDLQTWIPLQTNLLGSGPLYFSDAQSPANVRRFYRAHFLP